jgi:hypothetical protein
VAVERRVKQNANGRWVVVAPGAKKVSSVHVSRQEAKATARTIVHHAGGGEVVVERSDGQAEEKETVT